MARTMWMTWMAGVLLAVAAGNVRAGDLPLGIGLVNGDFDSDLVGWNNPYSRPATWDPLDADDDPASGSALLVNDMPVGNGATSLVLSQCFLVGGGETVAFGGHIRLPVSQPANAWASVFLWSYAADDCFSDAIIPADVRVDKASDDWQAVQQEITLAPQARSILLSLGVGKPPGVTGETKAYFDRLYMVIDGDGIFANGFEL